MGDRRYFERARLSNPTDWFAVGIATAGGAGLLPVAPGTFGTLVGIALLWLSQGWSVECQAALWIALLILGVWAAGRVDRLMGTSDNQNVVIDEVLGVAVAVLPFAITIPRLAAAFFLFRVFDIIKPPPVKWIDQVTKRHAAWSAFGVIADDLAAGVQALIVMWLLVRFGIV